MTRSLQFIEGKATCSAVKHDLVRAAYAFRATYSAVMVSSFKSTPHVDWSDQDSRIEVTKLKSQSRVRATKFKLLGCPRTKMWDEI